MGKSEAEIEFALNAGVKCFNMESIPEIDRIQKVAARLGKVAPVSLRVNPDVDAKNPPLYFHGLKANKFGIAYADALEAYRHASRQSHLKIVGIDCHIGSQLTDLQRAHRSLRTYLGLGRPAGRQKALTVEHLDLGGGVGIVYQDENIA